MFPDISEHQQLLELFEQEHKQQSIDQNNSDFLHQNHNHRCIIQNNYTDYQQCKSSHCQTVYGDVICDDQNNPDFLLNSCKQQIIKNKLPVKQTKHSTINDLHAKLNYFLDEPNSEENEASTINKLSRRADSDEQLPTIKILFRQCNSDENENPLYHNSHLFVDEKQHDNCPNNKTNLANK